MIAMNFIIYFYDYIAVLLLLLQNADGRKVIMHGHSTREDLRIFIGSNLLAPLWEAAHMYQKADYVITYLGIPSGSVFTRLPHQSLLLSNRLI